MMNVDDNPVAHDRVQWTWVRGGVLLAMLATLAPGLFATCASMGLSTFWSSALSGIVLAIVVPFAAQASPAKLGDGSWVRWLFVAWLILTGVSVYRLAHLSVFMGDPSRADFAMNPVIRELTDPDMTKPFFPKHNCFTCYIVAAHLASQNVENIYQQDHYRDPTETTPIHERIGDVLTIDRYQYPPPFLLLPKALLTISGDFFVLRALWFALNVLVMVVTFWLVASWVGGAGFGAAWLTWPIVFASATTMSMLQIGNAHFFVICLAMLGMLAFERRHHVVGGFLLAFAVVSKLFPAVLLAYLVFRRRWRAVGWTLAAAVVYCVSTWCVFGDKPFRAFLTYQVPRLSSGDAFSFARDMIRPLALNLSAIDIPYKLAKLGWLGTIDPKPIASVVSAAYALLLLLVVAVMGMGHARLQGALEADDANLRGPQSRFNPLCGRLHFAQAWLALLVLGQLRSPFLPWAYGGIAILWLLAMCLPGQNRWPIKAILVAIAWFAFSRHIPLSFGPGFVTFDLLYTLGGTAVALGLALFLTLRTTSGTAFHQSHD